MARELEPVEIRLVSFGAPDKLQPALLLTRSSALGYLDRITIALITSSIHGVPSEVQLGTEDGLKRECAVNLHNLMTISRSRLGKRISRLSEDRMRAVCRAVGFALGCES